MKTKAFIHSIGMAVPDNFLSQDELYKLVSNSLPDDERLQKFTKSLYKHSGIEKRHSAINDLKNVPDFPHFIPSGKILEEGPSTLYRNSIYIEKAPEIAEKAVKNALSDLPSLRPETITHLITLKLYWIFCTGFRLALDKKIGLKPDISRINIDLWDVWRQFLRFQLLWNRINICSKDLFIRMENFKRTNPGNRNMCTTIYKGTVTELNLKIKGENSRWSGLEVYFVIL